MDKKLKDFKKGGKAVLPDNGEVFNEKTKVMERKPRHYKLRTTEFKVVVGKGSGALYVVADLVAINKGPEQGNHTEMGFSLSANSESIASAWLTAMGVDEETIIPMDDRDRLNTFLNRHCVNAVVEANVIIGENEGYKNNQVSPPWEILAAELEEGDLPAQAGLDTERPPF